MKLGNERESANYTDDTNPSLASRLLTGVMLTMSRLYDPNGHQATLDKIQKQRDQNPLPQYNQKENEQTRVSRNRDGSTSIHRPGDVFDETAPAVRSNLPSDNVHNLSPHMIEVMTQAGLLKKR
jgi:hypothetical protein